ncbi:hypothetical protein LMG18090_04742 [Ralstonia mannitolilytica]|nr:hypothetical protein LMG18090_04742 [Ralstonia mannitolilytica]
MVFNFKTVWVFCRFVLGWIFTRTTAFLSVLAVLLAFRAGRSNFTLAAALNPYTINETEELAQHVLHGLLLVLRAGTNES